MTVVEEQAPGRAANKKARQERRAEIIARWDRRAALRLFAESKATAPSAVTANLLWLRQWASYSELLAILLAKGGEEAVLGVTASLLRVIELKEMPYDEYLQTPEWKHRADNAKARYGGRCALDESHPAEHAHHRTYERRGREHPDDLIPLCADCHAKFHNRRRGDG